MIYIPNAIIILLKKLKFYVFFKNIYKKLFENILPLEVKTIENYIINNLIDKNFGSIIDIGAHKGDKTSLILKFFPRDNYYLFEPYEEYYAIIKKKFINKNNINVYKKGVSSEEGVRKFYTSKNKMYVEAFSLNKNSFLENYEQIQVINLDKIIFKERVKLIKIDVEGHEPEILKGASKLIVKDKPILLIETSHDTHKKIEKILLDLNYTLLVYEYYIIKDSTIDYRELGDLTKSSNEKIISSNIFMEKLYKFDGLNTQGQLLTNSLAIPKSRENLLKIEIKKIFLN